MTEENENGTLTLAQAVLVAGQNGDLDRLLPHNVPAGVFPALTTRAQTGNLRNFADLADVFKTYMPQNKALAAEYAKTLDSALDYQTEQPALNRWR